MIFRFILLLFFLQVVLNVSAQKTGSLFKGMVVDATTGLPLNQVNISFAGKENLGTSTDSLGCFSININSFPIKLNFTSIGYSEKAIEITADKSKSLHIRLHPATFFIPEISVSAKRKIDAVFHEPLNVVDYAFKDDFIILLIYKNVFEKYQLVALDENERVVAALSLINYRPSSLFIGCQEIVYLTTDIGVYPVSVDSSSNFLGHRLDNDYYENLVQPCVLATDRFVYFTKYFYQGQAQQYFSFSKNDKEQKIIFPLIQHVHNIDLLIEETGTGFPRSGDVWQDNISKRLASLRNAPYGLKGMMKVFYPKIYSPMIRYDSLLCIFNHQEDEIQFYKEDGTKFFNIPIQYHLLKNWNKELIFDTKKEMAYTTFDTKWGYQICPIDLKTGALENAIPIDRNFIYNLKIHNGNLYFLYRNPYQGARNQMLQKIKID